MDRTSCINLINASHVARRLDFARSVAGDWLAEWPGDLEVQLLLAETDLAEGRHRSAASRLEDLLVSDPQYSRAYELLASALKATGEIDQAAQYQACARALRGSPPRLDAGPAWIGHVATVITALESHDSASALAASLEVIRANPDLPLPIYLGLRSHWASGDREGAFALARTGHDRWPACIPFRLLVAEDLISSGETSMGVELLHQVAAEDCRGRIVSRFFGTEHSYADLWPDEMTAAENRPVPAEVQAVMGANKLASPALRDRRSRKDQARTSHAKRRPKRKVEPVERSNLGEPDSTPQPEPWEAFRGPDSGKINASEDPDAKEAAAQAKQELDRVAEQINAPHRRKDEDNRHPAYLVLTSRTRLVQAFGENHFLRLARQIKQLCLSIRSRPDWTAYPLYIDDPGSLASFGIEPVDPANAWQIKLRLADIDQVLSTRGEMIGAVLIVGGHQIVPFHMLPNPTDDDDDAVSSDNPYAITDDNYFAPEWPVGRLPSDNDPNLLMSLLATMTSEHERAAQPTSIFARIVHWVRMRLGNLFHLQGGSLGYSASIWRKSSLAVFRTIGSPHDLLTSPPIQSETLPPIAYRPTQFSYYNLHGLEDAPEWFGQRDPLRDQQVATEFPVALQPSNVVNGGRSPNVIYTEACYGANTLGKTSETALCLKFLASGTHAVIGSTKISYGSVTPPLIAADLLGKRMWESLEQQFPVGEALRRSKLALVEEMYRRQGYLDGEDQKTLISFVLYGDPLYLPEPGHGSHKRKSILRLTTRPKTVRTVCALGGEQPANGELDPFAAKRARTIVARYLPGMADAQCKIRLQECGCQGEDHLCPTHQLGNKSLSPGTHKTLVVTFTKHVPEGRHKHSHYARLTLDRGGKVLKLAVSR